MSDAGFAEEKTKKNNVENAGGVFSGMSQTRSTCPLLLPTYTCSRNNQQRT